METEVKKRKLKLDRESQVSAIESHCLTMEVGEQKDFRILDTLVHQRLRTRLCLLKALDMRFETSLRNGKKNTVTVTRKT